jgi:hypothetical protein
MRVEWPIETVPCPSLYMCVMCVPTALCASVCGSMCSSACALADDTPVIPLVALALGEGLMPSSTMSRSSECSIQYNSHARLM